MILIALIAGGITLATILGLIHDLYDSMKDNSKRKKAELVELQYESVPCHACNTIPNTKSHECRIQIEILKIKKNGKNGFKDVLIDQQGKLKRCEKFHLLEVNANDCGKSTLRKIQTNEIKIFMTSIDNPEKAIAQTPRGKIEELTADVWAALILEYDFKCAYCGVNGDATSFHKEHKIPLARGGSNHAVNIVPSCAACNFDKKILTHDEYVTLRKERTEFLGHSNASEFSGNPLRPVVDKLPNLKDKNAIVVPRGARRIASFYPAWIKAIKDLSDNPEKGFIEEYVRDISEKNEINHWAFYIKTFKVTLDEGNSGVDKQIFKTYTSLARLLINKPKKKRVSKYKSRNIYTEFNHKYLMCYLSKIELNRLVEASDENRDLFIMNEKNNPVGLVKREISEWEDGKSYSLFHLYRIPQSKQLNIKVKNKFK